MERACVLIVDDRASSLAALGSVLGRAHQVLTARDGDEALALVEAVCLDLILTEVRLPGRSGFEVLHRVRERRLPTPVVVLAGRANVPDAVAAMQAGAFDYLAVPVHPEELERVVGLALAAGRDGGPAFRGAPPGAGLPAPPLELGLRGAVDEARLQASRAYLRALMRRHGGNVSQAAQQACMTRESLHRALRRLGPGLEDHPAAHADGAQGPAPTERR